MPGSDGLQRRIEATEFRMNFLEALLISSISEGRPRLPTIKEFVLSEVVNGAIDYVGGDAGRITYADFRFKNGFERELAAYFDAETALKADKLSPKTYDSLRELCRTSVVNPGPDSNYTTTGLYDLFRYVCPVFMQSTFSPSFESVMKVQKGILPLLSGTERNDVERIANHMRPFIDKDLAYIKKHYHW